MEKICINHRILVTGASGQLGRSLQKVRGEFECMDFFFPEEKDADITDVRQIETLISENCITAIINCAAYTAVDRAEEDEQTAYKINAYGPQVLAEICANNRIPLVHISTDYVFDGNSHEPYREDSPVNPLGAYGRTKLAGENTVQKSGCDAVVIRTSWLYSEFGNNFVATMLRLGEEGRSLKVVCDQTGTPTYATDLARAALTALQKGFSGFNILHYSALGHTTWCGFSEEIFRQSGIAADLTGVSTEEYPVKATRPKNSIMSMGKALSWGLPLRPWQEALAECLAEIKKND